MSFLRDLADDCGLRALDIHSAEMLERLYGRPCPALLLAAAFASLATSQGHTCLPLAELDTVLNALPRGDLDTELPSTSEQLCKQVLATGMVGLAGEHTPLILDKERLYLLRFYDYEEGVARWLRRQAAQQNKLPEPELTRTREVLARLFPHRDETADWQQIAAVLAVVKPFMLIAGGPGTGKTYTVARILALLQACCPNLRNKSRIALAAPTGKAALRLWESIHQAQHGLPDDLARPLAELEAAQTLHRLLGFSSGAGTRGGFFFHAGNPLPLDMLVLDEASMIDLPLMAALLDALPPHCRLILLGDPDQLASVEAGNLLGDICGNSGNSQPIWSEDLQNLVRQLAGPLPKLAHSARNAAHYMDDVLVFLRENRRFASHSAIAELAAAVRDADVEGFEHLTKKQNVDLHLKNNDASATPLKEAILDCFLPVMEADSVESALQALGRQRILCALREGPEGVEGINRLAEFLLRRLGHIPPDTVLYRGLPVMILRNDYSLGLFNGDTGILWPDGNGELLAWFPGENEKEKKLRAFNPARLPMWGRSCAMTVHKAQGSEFAHVFFILPGQDTPLLSRELLYTAITRARKELTIICGATQTQKILPELIQRRMRRYSGLAERLRQT